MAQKQLQEPNANLLIQSWQWVSRNYWLLIPFGLLLISALYQAIAPVREELNRSAVTERIEFNSPTKGSLSLFISYPRKLFRDSADTSAAALAVWIRDTTPMFGLEPSSITDTETTTSYIVEMRPSSDNLSFTDEEGRPISPQVVLTSSPFKSNPKMLYVHLAPGKSSHLPAVINLDLSVPGLYPMGTPQISMRVESKWSSCRRRFFNLLLGRSTLIGALLTSLGALGVQRWFQAQERHQEQLDKEKEARGSAQSKIDGLTSLLGRDPVAGAQRYEELRSQEGGPWAEEEVQDELQRVWSQGAPPELQHLFALWELRGREEEFSRKVDEIGSETVSQAIDWALEETRDEKWRSRATDLFHLLGSYDMEIDERTSWMVEKRLWRALLQIYWPAFSFWRLDFPPMISGTAEDQSVFDPFSRLLGAEEAERDILLAASKFYEKLTNFDGLKTPISTLVLGVPGAGKTTAALWLIHEVIQNKDIFPVYFPVHMGFSLGDLAEVTAQTLLRYLAFRPNRFSRLGLVSRAAITHLLVQYVAPLPGLELELDQAGLPRTGIGWEMRQEIKRCAKDIQPSSQSLEEIEILLGDIVPAGLDLCLLLDIQSPPPTDQAQFEEQMQAIVDWMDKLDRIGWVTKAFFPLPEDGVEIPSQEVWWYATSELRWEDENLISLFETRFERVFGGVRLQSLCDQGVRLKYKKEEELQRRLIAASGGTPRGLIQKGNLLLQHNEQEGLLSAQDLDDILGPYPPEESTL